MSDNYEWYIKADTGEYDGKWVAIVNQKIVVSGDDAEKVYREAERKHPKVKISIVKVPDREILVLLAKIW